MMNGTMHVSSWIGGSGGFLIPVLVVVILGLVAWFVIRRK
jgi:hypothetical protein